jgi:hypothetical protein
MISHSATTISTKESTGEGVKSLGKRHLILSFQHGLHPLVQALAWSSLVLPVPSLASCNSAAARSTGLWPIPLHNLSQWQYKGKERSCVRAEYFHTIETKWILFQLDFYEFKIFTVITNTMSKKKKITKRNTERKEKGNQNGTVQKLN